MIYQYKTALSLLSVSLLLTSQLAMAGDWSGLVSASVSRDDNVTLGGDSNIVSSNQKDYYLDVLGTAGKYLTGNKNNGVRFTGVLYNREYDTVDNFNFSLARGRLAYHKKFGSWFGRFGAEYDYLEFGGDPYESVLTVDAEGRHKISKQTEFRVRYRYSDINAESRRFNNLDGDRHQVRFQGRFKQGKNRYRLGYTFETNDRADRRTATSFSSSSPNRHIIRANAKIPLSAKWITELDLRYRYSRYKDDNVSAGISKRRNDDRFKARVKLAYKISKKTDVYLSYKHTNNNSNVNRFGYSRNEATVGVNYLF